MRTGGKVNENGHVRLRAISFGILLSSSPKFTLPPEDWKIEFGCVMFKHGSLCFSVSYTEQVAARSPEPEFLLTGQLDVGFGFRLWVGKNGICDSLGVNVMGFFLRCNNSALPPLLYWPSQRVAPEQST